MKVSAVSGDRGSVADATNDAVAARRWPAARGIPRSDRLAAVLALLALAAGSYIMATTIAMVVRDWSALPFADQWDELILSPRQLLTPWLFSQHNEHRILFPRLLFAIDTFAFAETNVFSLFCNVAFPLALAGLLVYAARRHGAGRGSDTVWVAGLSLGLLFSAMQFENFVSGFQLGFHLVELAMAGTVASVVLGRQSRFSLAAAIGCAAIAVYSLSSGVLVPVLAIVLAWWTRRPRAQIGVLIVAAAALIGSYLYGYHAPSYHSNPLHDWFRPGVEHYTAVYIGNPFGEISGVYDNPHEVAWASAFGVLGLALFAAAALLQVRRGRGSGGAQLVFLGIAGFVVGTAWLTALGRLKFGVEQALSSRYGSPTLLFWLSLALFLIIEIWRRRPGWRPVAIVLSLPCLFVLAAAQAPFAKIAWDWSSPRREAATALLANVDDHAVLGRVYPDFPPRLKEQVGRLRAQRLAIFADPWSIWLGTPLAAHVFLADPRECRGGIDEAVPLPGAHRQQWRASGWARDVARQTSPERIVLTDDAGRVVGYGLGGFAAKSGGAPESGWRGHFILATGGSVAAYALLDNDRAVCPLELRPDLSEKAVPIPSSTIRGGDCYIDAINGTIVKKSSIYPVHGMFRVSGWGLVSGIEGRQNDKIFLASRSDNGAAEMVEASETPRSDVNQFFKHPEMGDVGFEGAIDATNMHGRYTLSIVQKAGDRYLECKPPHRVIVETP